MMLFVHIDGDPVFGHRDYCARWDLMSPCNCEERKTVFRDKDVMGSPS